MRHKECHFTYKPGQVILRGEDTAIHVEAELILQRFESSALHYRITRVTKHKVVIKAIQ